MKTGIAVGVVAIGLCICAGIFAETGKSKITNATVAEMIKASLSDATIVRAIEQGPCDLDASPQGLIDLKKQGASEKVIEAVQAAAVAPSEKQVASQGAQNGSAALDPMTVMLLDGTNRTQLQSTRAQMRSSGSPFVAKVSAVLIGAKASQRVRSPKPVFELSLPSNLQAEGYIALIQPEMKKNERRMETMTAAAFVGAHEGKNRTIPLTIEKVGTPPGGMSQFMSYRVSPANPLMAGEYVLQKMTSQYYDFGVDPAN